MIKFLIISVCIILLCIVYQFVYDVVEFKQYVERILGECKEEEDDS